MRQLKNLNYLAIFLNEIECIPEDKEWIELSDFDIANIHPSENLYLIFLDLSGYIIRDKLKINFLLSVDMFTDNKGDSTAINFIDLVEVENKVKDKFKDRDSEFRKLIDNQIELLLLNNKIEINLE